MIIGNGLLAQAFAPGFSNNPALTVFASGVSNSRETRPETFAREKALLIEALDKAERLIYFSSCSVEDPELASAPYPTHKLEMEQLIANRARSMAIFRLPQIVGRTPNQHTLTNYLHHQIASGEPFKVWSRARRNLIDISDVALIAREMLDSGAAVDRITNIACPYSISVVELVHMFENMMGCKANYQLVDAGASYHIEVDAAMAAAHRIGLHFGPHYIDQLIRKYYANTN
jgi:nucleoside-diphosphate-sugar epimerase